MGALDPSFKYNIFSKKYNGYMWETMQAPSSTVINKLEVLKSDELELHLFQVIPPLPLFLSGTRPIFHTLSWCSRQTL